MLGGKRVLAIIPARGGSKGIPRKNIRKVCGRPLIAYSIDAALKSKYVDACLVSTEDQEIAEVARHCGAWVPFLRPAELAADTSKTIDCVVDAVDRLDAEGYHFDVVVLLQATSPLRDEHDVDLAIERYADSGGRGVINVTDCLDTPIFMRTMDEKSGCLKPLFNVSSTIRRQDMPRYYRIVGAVYVNSRDEVTPELSLNDNPVGSYLDPSRALDIDSPEDLELAAQAISAKLASR